MRRVDTPIIGYRLWLRNGQKLGSLTGRLIWEKGINKAECKPAGWESRVPCQSCPQKTGNCGFYGWNHPSGMAKTATELKVFLTNQLWIFGVIVGSGHVVLHKDGWRSEYAQIVALGDLNSPQDLADAYGVPCVPMDRLEMIAQEFGCAV